MSSSNKPCRPYNNLDFKIWAIGWSNIFRRLPSQVTIPCDFFGYSTKIPSKISFFPSYPPTIITITPHHRRRHHHRHHRFLQILCLFIFLHPSIATTLYYIFHRKPPPPSPTPPPQPPFPPSLLHFHTIWSETTPHSHNRHRHRHRNHHSGNV